MRLWGSFTYAVAAVLFGFLFERIGLAWMFPISAVGFLLVTACAFFMEEGDPVVKKTQSPWGLILRNKILLALLLAAVFFGAATNIFLFSSMYIVHLGGSELMAGLLLGATALLEVPAMHYGGGLMRRFGGMRTLLLGFGFFAAAFLIGIAAREPWVLLIAGMLEGGGFGLSFVAIVVIFDQHAPDNWSASIQSLVNAGMFGVAPFLSAIAFGAIYDSWPAGVYAFSLGLITCAILALLIAIRMESQDTPTG
jgi:PPP family 3-phenylpropionic acid transporter